jgi:hypothetical protein
VEAPAPVVPWAAPLLAGFAAGAALAAGLAGAGADLVVLAAATARQVMPSSPAKTNAEPSVMALRMMCVVIGSSFLFHVRAPFRMREHFYSTLLTFPFVKVTFISL